MNEKVRQLIVTQVQCNDGYDWRDEENKDSDDLTYYYDELEEHGVQRIYYWYLSGSYEGSGYIVMLRDNKRYTKYMGHCSCYGPLENTDYNPSSWTDINGLIADLRASKQKKIFEAMKKDGFISSDIEYDVSGN